MELNEATSLENLFICAEEIKNRGDLLFIKIDGERDNNHITIIISYPSDIKKEQIRYDGNDLRELLFKAIKVYYKNNVI